MIFDPSYLEIDPENFPRDWNNFYGDVDKEIPPDMPKPLGKKTSFGSLLMPTILVTGQIEDPELDSLCT